MWHRHPKTQSRDFTKASPSLPAPLLAQHPWHKGTALPHVPAPHGTKRGQGVPSSPQTSTEEPMGGAPAAATPPVVLRAAPGCR